MRRPQDGGRGDHRGGDHADSRGDPHRVGDGPAAVRIDVSAMRTSRVVSCSSPFAAPVTRPKAPQNTPNTEKPAGSRSRAARYSTAYPHSAVITVAMPTRATLPRVTGPVGVPASVTTSGTGVEYSQASHSGRSEVVRVVGGQAGEVVGDNGASAGSASVQSRSSAKKFSSPMQSAQRVQGQRAALVDAVVEHVARPGIGEQQILRRVDAACWW